MRRSRSAMASLALTALLAAGVAGVGCDNSEANGNNNGTGKRVFSAADISGFWANNGGHDVPRGQTWILLPSGELIVIMNHDSMMLTLMTWSNYLVVPGSWRLENGNELYTEVHGQMMGKPFGISTVDNILEVDTNKMVLEDQTHKNPDETFIRIHPGTYMENEIISILKDHGWVAEE